MRQWGANLAVMAGHRGMPGAGEAMVALGDRLRLEADQVCESGGGRGAYSPSRHTSQFRGLNMPNFWEDKLHWF